MSWVGSRVKRVEDPALLKGQGRFVDDIHLPGMLQATILRSVHGHARIRGIDTAAALKMPGVHGVFTHGVGNALYEWMRYDGDAQPLTANFGEYLMPLSTDMPAITLVHSETPTPLNPLGVKGAGEGGTIPAPAAIAAAVEDALSPFGVHVAQVPVTPTYLLDLLDGKG